MAYSVLYVLSISCICLNLNNGFLIPDRRSKVPVKDSGSDVYSEQRIQSLEYELVKALGEQLATHLKRDHLESRDRPNDREHLENRDYLEGKDHLEKGDHLEDKYHMDFSDDLESRDHLNGREHLEYIHNLEGRDQINNGYHLQDRDHIEGKDHIRNSQDIAEKEHAKFIIPHWHTWSNASDEY